MNIRVHFGRRASTMPDDVRHALLMILYYTLLSIRSAERPELTFALSDHVHNIPGLIDRYKPDAFCYYWELERPSFIDKMQKLEEPVMFVQEYWDVLEKHYDDIKCHWLE